MEWLLVGISIFFGYLIGCICGGRMGVDSCSEYIDDSVKLEHIKDCIFNEKISDKKKVLFIKSMMESNIEKSGDVTVTYRENRENVFKE